MSGIGIRVGLVDTGLDQSLAHIALMMGNLKPAMAEIGQAGVSLVQLGFRNSEDPYGNKWAAIKPRPAKAGGNIGGADKPLLDTGRLRGSFAYEAHRDRVFIGTNVSYANKHQTGDRVKQRMMLPDVGMPMLWEQEIIGTMNDYITGVLNGSI
jgi:phage gpG-like protein